MFEFEVTGRLLQNRTHALILCTCTCVVCVHTYIYGHIPVHMDTYINKYVLDLLGHALKERLKKAVVIFNFYNHNNNKPKITVV